MSRVIVLSRKYCERERLLTKIGEIAAGVGLLLFIVSMPPYPSIAVYQRFWDEHPLLFVSNVSGILFILLSIATIFMSVRYHVREIRKGDNLG